MEINRLSQEELAYELNLRGLPTGKVEDMRTSLREALRVEKGGKQLILNPYPFTFDEDSAALNKKVEEVRSLLDIFEGDSGSTEYRKICTKIEWALGRLSRTKPQTEDERKETSQIRANLVLALGSLQLKADGSYQEGDSSDEAEDLSMTAKALSNVHNRISLHKWETKFSGDAGQSLNSFLDRVNELAEARGITKYQLFRSALDLFSGKALIWYRANKSKFHSWTDLIKELKKEFLPHDYDDRLMDEIRRRTQGNGETIGLYVAVMTNMFARLSNPLTEDQKLRILKRNINPFYQTQLGLVEVETVQDLIELGRKLEASRNSVETYVPPPSRKSNQLLEPDLAYVSAGHTVSAVVNRPSHNPTNGDSRIKCFRCHRFGHIARFCRGGVRCYGCGAPGVTRTRCENCANSNGVQVEQNRLTEERPRPQRVGVRDERAQGNQTPNTSNQTSGNANRARQ